MGTPSLRTVPVQKRSRQTVESVLAAAAQVLADGGPDALTTSAVAARTGLHVRNVYRYFPDRRALIAALAARLNDSVEEAVGGLADLADPSAPWRPLLRSMIRGLVALAAEHPEAAQIRAAMRSTPDLQALDFASDARIADVLHRALRARGCRPAGRRLGRRCLVLVTAIGAVLDRALLDPDENLDAMVSEAEELAAAYLAAIIEPAPDRT